MMFHEVSYTSIDNSIVFLLGGITVGLTYSGEEPRRNDRGRSSDQRQSRRKTDTNDSPQSTLSVPAAI
jgi:hypothetical protein